MFQKKKSLAIYELTFNFVKVFEPQFSVPQIEGCNN